MQGRLKVCPQQAGQRFVRLRELPRYASQTCGSLLPSSALIDIVGHRAIRMEFGPCAATCPLLVGRRNGNGDDNDASTPIEIRECPGGPLMGSSIVAREALCPPQRSSAPYKLLRSRLLLLHGPPAPPSSSTPSLSTSSVPRATTPRRAPRRVQAVCLPAQVALFANFGVGLMTRGKRKRKTRHQDS